jgi:hypothetical protein
MGWLRAALILFAVPGFVQAADEAATMDLCRAAAIRAADDADVPRKVMLAITEVETRTRRGGQSGPWPWTVNVAGKGDWFVSRAAALLHAQTALAGGETSFDVGCFQLNYRWHGQNFSSIDAMFEPATSGAYAARFLKTLHAETGDWMRAAGLYHSRTAAHAKRYRALVARAIARIEGAAAPAMTAAAPPAGPPRRGADAPSARGPHAPLPPSSGGVALVILRRAGGSLIGMGG